MKIDRIKTFAVRIPRDHDRARGGAGSPAALHAASSRYSFAKTYGTVYASDIETCIVKLTTTDGVVGWGEAQAPVVPEVVQDIIDLLVAPLLLGQNCASPEFIRGMLYDAMRVRGHFGGFYVDAISAIDCALWDLAGKYAGLPVYRMLGNSARTRLPVYVSGLNGTNREEQLRSFDQLIESGARALKIFMADDPAECLSLIADLRRRSSIELFVDALWRFDYTQAADFVRELQPHSISWLEAPLVPEDVASHKKLAAVSPVRIAIGESYRTCFEVLPFLEAGAMNILQPDLGRCGITEAHRMAALAEKYKVNMAPHISIGLGPQIAAALHSSSVWSHLEYVECNPKIYAIAERFQSSDFRISLNTAELPECTGLGIHIHEEELARFSRVKCASFQT